MPKDPKHLINVRFVLRTDQHPDQSGKHAIHMILSKGKGKATISSGEKCPPEQWNANTGFTKIDEINTALVSLREKAYNSAQKLYLTGKIYSPKAIKADLIPEGKYSNQGQLTLKDLYMDRLARKSRGKHGYTAETLRNYTSRWTRIEGYLKYQFGKPDIPVSRVDKQFAQAFNEWMLYHEDPDSGIKHLSPHTAVNIHKKLRATIREAIIMGISMVNPYDYFELSEKPSDPTYLTKAELKRVMEVELPTNTASFARDYFVLSAFTAFRIKDAQSLTWDDVIEADGQKWLRLKRIAKTRVPNHEVPVFPQVEKILRKYKPYQFRENRILPPLEAPTINRWLKVVAALAGIKNKVLSHNVSRHTCATTVLLDNGFQLNEAQRFMGHRSIRSTMVYGKVTNSRLQNVATKAYKKFAK